MKRFLDRLADIISGNELSRLRSLLLSEETKSAELRHNLKTLWREVHELNRQLGLSNYMRRESEVHRERANRAADANVKWRLEADMARAKAISYAETLKTIAEIPVHIRSNGTVRRLVRLAKDRLS
ncbi:hypothetical protein [Pseudogemmobacter sonorensis]|uniref:hypothetical protein n=1 Tax=Pseudogemmobacter sonorensis TaxID=2989681 RepID=UPI00367B1A36